MKLHSLFRPVALAALLTAALLGSASRGADGRNDQEKAALAVLRSDAAEADKALACKHLAIYGSADAVPDLAKLLADITQVVHQTAELHFQRSSQATEHGFDQVVAILEQPVHRGKADRENGGPFVHSVDAVHAAERTFQPARTGCQHHRERHQADCEQAAEVERLALNGPGQRVDPLATHTECAHPGNDEQRNEAGQIDLHDGMSPID